MRVSVESARGCGFRQPGGLYLVSGALSEPCPLLPIEMIVCPTCGEGIKPARGFTWVDGQTLIPPVEHGTGEHDLVCPLSPLRTADGHYMIEEGGYVSRIGRCGLIWIGERFYPTPQDFMREAERMGVSRRIVAVPKGFEVGETWVLLGHRKAIEKACSECGDLPEAYQPEDEPAMGRGAVVGSDPECPVCNGTGYEHKPGIITAFKPTAVEYVVKGDETEEELEALEKRGIEPVKVIREGEQEAMEVE